MHLNKFAEVVKEAIIEAGGIPFEFNTIGVDDSDGSYWYALFFTE